MIQTHLGYRAYAEKELTTGFDTLAAIADGTYLADGTNIAGSDSIGVIDKSARVISFSSFERTIQPQKNDVLTAYSGKQLQHISIELNNTDRYFSRLIPKEPFLGRPVNVYVGFESDPQGEHLSIFRGIISELSVMQVFTIEADER
jgi:hypothetical protein